MDSVLNTNSCSVEQNRFLEMVSTSILHGEDQHYEMPLSVRDDGLRLPNNKKMVEKRAELLNKRFLKNPEFHKDYQNFMNDMIRNGYAEVVENYDNGEPGRVWYIPHHGVYHKNKPDKLRVVFDCSGKYQGDCLNDCLYQGPNLLGVLLRFRSERIALQSNIKAMFHQLRVPATYRDLLRFLWWKGGLTTNELQTCKMCVYLFGTVSSPACANYALRRPRIMKTNLVKKQLQQLTIAFTSTTV